MQVANRASTRTYGSRVGRALSTLTLLFMVWLGGSQTAYAQTGRPFTSDDWSNKIPIVFGAICVVILVNSIGMYFVFRSRQAERDSGQA